MNEEEMSAEASAPLEEEELEFRPWVKWTAVGMAGALSVGLFLLVYKIGHWHGENVGFHQAITSGVVHESLNAAASQNVLNFMQLASASKEMLLAAAADTEKAFGWVKDAPVRREAEWSLAQALLERRLSKEAEPVLEKLYQAVPHSPEWAYRAAQAADNLASGQQYQSAVSYYKIAAAYFAENGLQKERLIVLEQLVALVTSSPNNNAKAENTVKALLKMTQDAGAGAEYLSGIVHAHYGELLRCKGEQEAAEKQFQQVLNMAPSIKTDSLAWAAAYGMVLQECGDVAAAEPLLRKAERNTSCQPSDISARLLALRHLAIIEQGKGHHVTAMALLHRAQGVAEGRVQLGNAFWPCLFDQRGWMHYIVQNYQTALLDFTHAMSVTHVPQQLMQSQEGAARCYLEMGKTEQALPLLTKCLELRQKHAAADKAAIGRVQLLLGQIYDQQGKTPEAKQAYAQAVLHLLGDASDTVYNRRSALLGLAYAQTQLKEWNAAYESWTQVLPLLEGQFDRLEEARSQMRLIKPHISADKPADSQEAASAQ